MNAEGKCRMQNAKCKMQIEGRSSAATIWNLKSALCILHFALCTLHSTGREAVAQPSPPAKASVGWASLSASPAQADRIARREETQKRVRSLARELISGVLESQLRQLEENDLTSTPWYRDISLMRKNLDALIEAEMPKVVELLNRIPAAGAKERDTILLEARKKSRAILVELLTQRQSVLRRLRMAEMAAQVRQLIKQQTKVLQTTESLPEKSPAERESTILAAVEDQRDVKEMFLKLEDLLKDVANWGGEVGAEAAGGLRLIEAGRVEAELNTSVRSLEQTQFPQAAESQKNVIRVLEALLKTIERVQGLLKDDRGAVERAIEELAQRQKDIREATSQPDPSPQDAEQLRERQDAVKGDVAELGKQTEQTPAAEPLEEARKAAEQATEKLFEGKQKEALAQQDKVLENLDKAARQVQQAAARSPAAKPDALAQMIKDLEAAKRDVEKIQGEQKQASAAAEDKPQDAGRQESQISQELGEVPKNRTLPQPVNERLADAKEAAGDAAGAMDRAPPERRDATRRAEQAIQRAASEIDAALADAKRRQLAQSVQQLAAAGQSQEMARAAQQLAQMADQQLQAAGQVQEAIQNAMAAQPEPMAQRIDRLSQAEEKVQQAAADQQRAAGRPEAAQAMDLAAGIRKAIQKQDAADRAAEALGKRPDASPLEAVTKQQDVSQAAAQLAKQASGDAPGKEEGKDQGQSESQDQGKDQGKAEGQEPANPVAKELKQAEKSGREAARDLLVAKPQEAQNARAQTRKALQEALRLANEQAAHAAEAPAGTPDAAAQARTGQEAAAARELAQPDAPQAAQTLGEAGKTSEQAQQQLAGEKAQAAAPAQEATAGSLEQAAAQLAEAKARLAEQAAQQMAAAAQAAEQLANQAAPVDPGATAALQAAENRAAQAAAEIPQAPQSAQSAEQGVRAAMDQAMAELGARQQQVLQDRALAMEATQPSDRASPIIGGGGMARSGQQVRNQLGPEMPLQPREQPQGDTRTGDAANPGPAGPERPGEKPWMAELPPEVRDALRVNSARRPPRGYEEILRRYFKNID